MWLQELAKQIDDYTATYEPEDQLEWSLVLGEIRAFIEVSVERTGSGSWQAQFRNLVIGWRGCKTHAAKTIISYQA